MRLSQESHNAHRSVTDDELVRYIFDPAPAEVSDRLPAESIDTGFAIGEPGPGYLAGGVNRKGAKLFIQDEWVTLLPPAFEGSTRYQIDALVSSSAGKIPELTVELYCQERLIATAFPDEAGHICIGGGAPIDGAVTGGRAPLELRIVRFDELGPQIELQRLQVKREK